MTARKPQKMTLSIDDCPKIESFRSFTKEHWLVKNIKVTACKTTRFTGITIRMQYNAMRLRWFELLYGDSLYTNGDNFVILPFRPARFTNCGIGDVFDWKNT